MTLTLDQALEAIRNEVQDEDEMYKLLQVARKNERFLRPLELNEVVSFVRHVQQTSVVLEPAIGQKRDSSEAYLRKVAEEVFEETFKKRRVSVTNIVELGATVLEQANEWGTRLFDKQGWSALDTETLEDIAQDLKGPYEQLRAIATKWQAEAKHPNEAPVQEFAEKLYEVFMKNYARGARLVGDTSSLTGIGEGKKTVQVICEKVVALPHVVMVHVNKPNMSSTTDQKEAAGQLKQHKERIVDQQPGRKLFVGLTMGWDLIDFWIFPEGSQPLHTGPLPFSAELDSPALQGCTSNDVLGYQSPAVPTSIKIVLGKDGFSEGTVIDSLSRLYVMEDASTGLTRAEVLQGTLTQTGDVVALKTGKAIECEIHKMSIVGDLKLDGIIQYCGVAASKDGRRWIVTRPVGKPIDDGGDPTVVIERFQKIAATVGHLYQQHQLLHGDLSYANLIAAPDGPRIIDWGTLQSAALQDAKRSTVTPLFMALSTLQGQPATLSSELESLANVVAHIATGDGLHWRHELVGTTGMVDSKFAGWTLHFESKMMARISEKAYEDVIRKLQALFFPIRRHRTDVTVEDFLDALKV